MPAFLAELRNVSGSTDGRDVFGASFPFGPVTPQATFSPSSGPRNGEWTPSKTALQIFAYWSALSMRHVLPTFLYCGESQSGLFGSFHAVHMLTFGSGVL